MMSQDHQDRRVYLASQVGLDPRDSQEDLVYPELKVNQALPESDHQEQPDPRYRTHLNILCSEKSAYSGSHLIFFMSEIG